MAATPYRPVSFDDRSLSVEKLQQVQSNIQWLFENTPRMRYTHSQAAIIRDSGIKIIAGKTPYGGVELDFLDVSVYFGSFFSSACRPVVTASVESSGNQRRLVTLRGINGEIDYRGFIGHVSDQENHAVISWNPLRQGGWLHWTAVGF